MSRKLRLLMIITSLIVSLVLIGCEVGVPSTTDLDLVNSDQEGNVNEKQIESGTKDQDQTSQLNEPKEPNQPTQPNEPKEPNQPSQPNEPKEPSQPSQPSEPKEPSKSTQPSEPKEPKSTQPKDTTSPKFSGVDDKKIEFGSSIDLLNGVKAIDDVDGDVTKRISVSGEVDTNKSGTYKITYLVSDKSGNTKTHVRQITVKSSPFVFNADLTNKVRTEQKRMRADLDYYTDHNGTQVAFFDDVFQKFHTGKYTTSQVKKILEEYSWEEPIYFFENPEAIFNYYIPSMYSNIREGETQSTDPKEILRTIFYRNNSDYNRIAIYTNAEGLNKIYAIAFNIYNK